ncbi:hypothetical protein ZIOFF_054964 [Zingiber officinale]|uniref:Uncharacterized protein n=1 Tax=Zingiber officinale TaxID=94328 RepID=A0A8J5KPN8_ZINOF|nr:hypothetical protein ZIOFF_054964 [Zingiber officinale]
MEDMRKQFLDRLFDVGFVDKIKGAKAYNQYGDGIEMVCLLLSVLCAGLDPNVIPCKRRGKRTTFYSEYVGKVCNHPSSGNARINLFPLPYMIFSDKHLASSFLEIADGQTADAVAQFLEVLPYRLLALDRSCMLQVISLMSLYKSSISTMKVVGWSHLDYLDGLLELLGGLRLNLCKLDSSSVPGLVLLMFTMLPSLLGIALLKTLLECDCMVLVKLSWLEVSLIGIAT